MRGGMRMPPNLPCDAQVFVVVRASMRGGMRMPPNQVERAGSKPWWSLQ